MMECSMCGLEGSVRVLPLTEGAAVTVMCAEHDVASLRAVACSDYEALVVSLRVREPYTDVAVLRLRAQMLAALRVAAIQRDDDGLLADLLEAVRGLPVGADHLDEEWAMLATMRGRGL